MFINLHKKVLFISLSLVILLTLAFAVWALVGREGRAPKIVGLADKDALASSPATQTYKSDKTPTLNDDDLIQGGKNSALKIFVYEDYASIYSAELAATLKRLALDYPSAAFIFRPYISKNNSLSAPAAQALLCSADKWSVMRDNIYKLLGENNLSLASITESAGTLGINTEEFNQCLLGLPSLEKSAKLSDEAKDYSVLGAPTLFINGNMVVGARPYEDYTDSNGDKVEGLKAVVDKIINK